MLTSTPTPRYYHFDGFLIPIDKRDKSAPVYDEGVDGVDAASNPADGRKKLRLYSLLYGRDIHQILTGE